MGFFYLIYILMRYLKLYEKIFGSDESKVRKFCEEYLIYLLDDNFQLTFNKQSYDKIDIYLRKYVNGKSITFDWDYIKSDFITLIEILSTQTKNDELKFILTKHKGTKSHILIMCYEDVGRSVGQVYDFNTILNDDIGDKHLHNITGIGFTVRKLKE